ncbi:sigma-54-dependent Fis family transcriptional regulator [Amycolatopsis eburnea]|uniref:Fis family transcriptional regulator n=1 Tax=Amycolatopsis eburnea TaxID=2267691 RepID=A0A3R9EN85_9PSEU|nr:helix-turn-helix domain-containing protein [Amycolatopsis eburnea]RSD12046.1 Fis family transcriptional regulator [Amycolatopsis eburnea]
MRESTSLRAEIALSWRRARLGGVAPDNALERAAFRAVDRSSRLVVAARPVLDEMADQLRGTRFCTILGDSSANIVDRWCDDTAVEHALDRIGALPGRYFAEESAGTNGLGTPLEVGRGMVVHGGEHYVEALKAFSCYGHPIYHPVTRRIAGVLDITGITRDANPMLAPFLVRAVRDIERRLLEGARLSERRLLNAFQTAMRECPGPVLVFGADVVLMNQAATDLLDAADHGVLRALALDGPDRESWTRRLSLGSGAGVRVLAERIPGTGDGTLLRLEPDAAAPTPAVREFDPLRQLRSLRGTGGAVLIGGEPGTGRTSAAHAIADGRASTVLDATDLPVLGETAWARRLDEAAAGGDVLVVEEIHLLPPVLRARLVRTLAARGDRPTVLIGPADARSAPETAGLASTCRAAVELPPLRERAAELPALVKEITAKLRPGCRLRFTSSAVAALAAQPWPANLRELETVLRQVIGRRTTGDVVLTDLPPQYRAVPKTTNLGGRERAERAAIVEALRGTDGNKVQAARRLGVSRTTLYSRMRALGVPG